MERLLIILAVLVCVAAGIAVVTMAARGQRPPLRMDAELDADDEHLLLGSVGTPGSPIDRSAQVLDAQMLDLEPIEAPGLVEGPRVVGEPGQVAAPQAGRTDGAR